MLWESPVNNNKNWVLEILQKNQGSQHLHNDTVTVEFSNSKYRNF